MFQPRTLVLLLFAALIGCRPVRSAPGADSLRVWQVMSGLPALAALEAHPDSGLLALAPGQDLLLHLSVAGQVWRQAGGTGSGPGAFRHPVDVDAGQGLQILVLDRDNRRLCAFSRRLAPLAVQPLPAAGDGDNLRPSLLAVGGAGMVLVADPDQATVQVSRNNGASWETLLDYGRRAGALDHIDAMALDGLDLWLLQRRVPASLLVRTGVDFTRPLLREEPGLLLIRPDHRSTRGPARLWHTAAGLVYEDALGRVDLPPLPDGADPVDMLRIGDTVWLSLRDGPALRCPIRSTGP